MSKELLRLPGLVDPHVHLREPGATQKEDFETGTRAALAGGYTTVLDMPNNPEPTVSPQALQKKIELAGNRIFCDVGFHFGTTRESSQYFEQVVNQVFGLKLYMTHTTGPLLVENPQDQEIIFAKWPKGRLILIHGEGGALQRAIDLARKYRQRLHICHVSLKSEIELIKAVKEEGLPITCEVTPHHLFLTEDDAKILGPFGVMRPPLGSEEDQRALWENLAVIDAIASDHAPHTIEEKRSEKPPFGVPGLETTLPLLLSAVADRRLTLERLIELTSKRPKEIFGLPDKPDAYTEIDLKESYVIDSANLQTKCGWTPFDGKRVTGRIVKVVLRGEVVFDGEKVVSQAKGRVAYPYNE